MVSSKPQHSVVIHLTKATEVLESVILKVLQQNPQLLLIINSLHKNKAQFETVAVGTETTAQKISK